MAWSLVTPANRGIGFALTRHLLQTTRAPVVATTRRDPDGVRRALLTDLNDVDSHRLNVLELDVTGNLRFLLTREGGTDEASISAAAARVRSLFTSPASHLRLAYVIPGILHPERSPSQIDATAALDTFKINALGPMLVMKHFSDFLPGKKTTLDARERGFAPHAVWATMSARVGSTTDNGLGGWYSYRASKAAVNSFTKTFDLFLRNRSGEKAMAIATHPGTVKTGLSEEFWGNVEKGKLFSPEYAAERLAKLARELQLEEGRGRCWDWAGKEIPP
ncbi:MAG: hypothetical protein M1818_008145 [Claussenomyces sp. TS43310]|nr:MAG: hypothetical protein M1818_008145 [Claussenomyces sp. TS43310]